MKTDTRRAGSRNIATDSNGDIYVCGNTKQGFYEVVVTKINSREQ
ncbi:MAG: SBBP repeat-containing protein [Bacteroidetes bacterium]|nr:SBBP repeat-containing protein [Bacteroidota bacterium]